MFQNARGSKGKFGKKFFLNRTVSLFISFLSFFYLTLLQSDITYIRHLQTSSITLHYLYHYS